MTKRLVLALTSVAAVVALAVSIPMVLLVMRFEQASVIDELRVETLSTAAQLAAKDMRDWPTIVAAAPSRADERVIVVDAQRRLIADSDATNLDRSFDRPEIVQALQGLLASDVRTSVTLGHDLRFVAAPIVQERRIVAAVRYSLPEDTVVSGVQRTALALAGFTLAVMFVAALIALLIARSIAHPMRRLATTARHLSHDLASRADTSSGPREVRDIAEAMNGTAERLQLLVARTERVAADASHHLRTPLTGIRLRLEAIEDLAEADDVRAEAASAIAEVDRLNHRIDQVLALARADAGSTHLVRLDMTEVVEDRIEQFAPIAEERGLRVLTDLTPDCLVQAEGGAVPRMVDELLGNALQYARSTIVVSIHRSATSAELVVADDGPGVPPEEHEAIFGRFTRGRTAVPGGTGLGLALVRETAVANGGRAWVDQAAAGGLAVHVVLPLEGMASL